MDDEDDFPCRTLRSRDYTLYRQIDRKTSEVAGEPFTIERCGCGFALLRGYRRLRRFVSLHLSEKDAELAAREKIAEACE